jgi:hypothetical protein
VPKKNGLTKKISVNGHLNNNGHTVITKESLTLMPDDVACGNNNKEQPEQPSPTIDESENIKRALDFKIEDCLEYM